MPHRNRLFAAALFGAGAIAVTVATAHPLLSGRHVRQAAASPQVPIAIVSRPPKGAVVLYGGTDADIRSNWYQRYGTEQAHWSVDASGVATPDGHDISSKQEFGDCYVHVEFQEPVGPDGRVMGDGNSGVGLEGRYEIQILNSYGQQPEAHGCGALYSEKPPRVVASTEPRSWQSYDIIFRAPRFDAAGKKTEQARATVFQNGILVQNNEEFSGMTGIQYDQYHSEVATGPLVLQGDHDPVHFRNVWVVPL